MSSSLIIIIIIIKLGCFTLIVTASFFLVYASVTPLERIRVVWIRVPICSGIRIMSITLLIISSVGAPTRITVIT